jgi:hypothetical protein
MPIYASTYDVASLPDFDGVIGQDFFSHFNRQPLSLHKVTNSSPRCGSRRTLNAMPKPLLVVSLATHEIASIRELTFPNKRAYCNRHGYVFCGITERLDPDRPHSWSKIVALETLCTIAPDNWAMWIDADAIFTRFDWRAEELIEPYADFIAAKDHNGINCGVFLIHLGDAMRRFLNHVYVQEMFINHRWWEQAAIRNLIENGQGPKNLHLAEKRLMNAYPDDFVEGYSAVLHVPDNPRVWPDRIAVLRKCLPALL